MHLFDADAQIRVAAAGLVATLVGDAPTDAASAAPAMAWRVVDAQVALKRALDLGATEYTGPGKSIGAPAVYGIGGSLLYFIDKYGAEGSAYEADYAWLDEVNPRPEGFGFYYLDHLTHNVIRGNMDTWYRFYATVFNFREIRYFDIAGKQTGLTSRALTSPEPSGPSR